MERNRLRAALVALCVLAVIFGASLFPATGFGSFPAGPGGGSRADNPGGANAGSQSDTGVRTPSDDGTVAVTTARTTSSESSDESADSGTTTTPTTTAVAASNPSHSSNGGYRFLETLQKAVGALLLVGVVILGICIRIDTVGFGGTGTISITIRGIPLGELIGKIPARTMGLVVGFSASIPRLVDDAFGLLAEVGRGLSTGTVGLGSALVEAVTVIGRGFSGTLLAIGSVGNGLFSVPNTLSRPTLGRGDRKSKKRTTAGEGTTPPEPEERGPPNIEEAWESMTERLPVRHRRTTTPAEYAREAMKRGYPADAVRQLTDAFREVRYGSFPPNENRTELARAALEKIDRFREDD